MIIQTQKAGTDKMKMPKNVTIEIIFSSNKLYSTANDPVCNGTSTRCQANIFSKPTRCQTNIFSKQLHLKFSLLSKIKSRNFRYVEAQR